MRPLTVLLVAIAIVNADAKNDCRTKLEECEARKPASHKQVCGSDNRTYPNRCALLRVQCAQNSPLTVKHRGRCKEKQPCWMDQGKKMAARNNNNGRKPVIDYMPECLADGTYAPIQCHKSVGYCWCVSPNGKIIAGSPTKHTRPNCPKRGKKGSHKGKSENTDSPKKNCEERDKNAFINNLVGIFKTEFNREKFGKQYENLTGPGFENNAIEWKFFSLDKDRNNILSKNEYSGMRKLIKKIVKPRRCSRKFIQNCDNNYDMSISKQEWLKCLSVNETHTLTKSVREDIRISPLEQDAESTEVEIQPARDPASALSNHSALCMADDEPNGSKALPKRIIILEESGLPLNDRVDAAEDEYESKVNDCLSDRKAVLDELKYGDQGMYVPECTSDGRYKKVQCYKSTGYCWCVMEDSGKPIPGTPVKDTNPKCDGVQNSLRQMKGCPEHKKGPFIKNLMEYFRKNLSATVTKEIGDQGDDHLHEQIFDSLDTNKNTVLDRNEWKVFQSMMSTSKLLRRCGRKLPRFCDTNHDQKILLTEWMQCLNFGNRSNVSASRRLGPNPLDSYLKDD